MFRELAQRAHWVLPLLSFLPLLAGCQPAERVSDCRKIAQVVNPVVAAVDAQRHQTPADPRTYRTIAAQYEWLANAVGDFHVRPKRFEDALLDYQRMLREAGHDARTFADALAAKDPFRIAQARTGAAHTVKHEASAMGRLDAMCHDR